MSTLLDAAVVPLTSYLNLNVMFEYSSLSLDEISDSLDVAIDRVYLEVVKEVTDCLYVLW